MSVKTRFLFDTDFRRPAADPAAARAAEEAEALGYMRGLADGQRQGEVEAQARIAAAAERIAAAMGRIVAEGEARDAENEALAMDFAVALARKLAADAIARDPLDAIAAAGAEAFRHLRGVPHVVVRVHESLVEPVKELMARLSRERGFDGKMIILGEPDIAAGDARVEWADGGVVRDQAQIESAVLQTLQAR